MSDIALDFTGLFLAFGIAAVAGLVATPVLCRLAAPLPRLRRSVLALLSGQGLAGAAAAPAAILLRDREIPSFALTATLILQLLLLPFLLFFARKG